MEPSDPATVIEMWGVIAFVTLAWAGFLAVAVWGLARYLRKRG